MDDRGPGKSTWLAIPASIELNLFEKGAWTVGKTGSPRRQTNRLVRQFVAAGRSRPRLLLKEVKVLRYLPTRIFGLEFSPSKERLFFWISKSLILTAVWFFGSSWRSSGMGSMVRGIVRKRI